MHGAGGVHVRRPAASDLPRLGRRVRVGHHRDHRDGVEFFVTELAQQLGELCAQSRRIFGAVLRLCRSGASDQHIKFTRSVRDEIGNRWHRVMDVLKRDVNGTVATKCLGSGQELVQDQPHGIHVGGCVGPTVLNLLGGEVGRRAPHDVTGATHRAGGDGPGQSEVGDLHGTLGIGENVFRFDVAVDQAGTVGGGQGLQDLVDDRGGRADRQRGLIVDDVAQVASRDQLHDQIHQAVIVALVIDRDHVRVRQLRGAAGFALEATHEVEIASQVRAHDLHRDRTIQSQIVSPIDRGHSTLGNVFIHPISTV